MLLLVTVDQECALLLVKEDREGVLLLEDREGVLFIRGNKSRGCVIVNDERSRGCVVGCLTLPVLVEVSLLNSVASSFCAAETLPLVPYH